MTARIEATRRTIRYAEVPEDEPAKTYPWFGIGTIYSGGLMDLPDTTLEILTLGRFSISINGNSVATDWPDESIKVFFCSLLSPLDLYFTWDRMCRSMWNVPVNRTSRRRLEDNIIRPLNSFLNKELGYNPLVAGKDGIRIDHRGVHIDAHEFHSAVVEGLALLTLGSHAAALEKLSRANSLYAGSYLPGITGKIIDNARKDLDSLYRTAVLDGIWQARSILYARTTQHVPERIRRTA